ncbi:hypothetical protein A2U01_0090508, partial [Trifolium medium]|nr:hypothetical protein [Trifolium medium]
ALHRSWSKSREHFWILRVAQLSQVVEGNHLEVARRAGWVGATRQYKNSKLTGITDTCASHMTGGAAREHGKLCRF